MIIAQITDLHLRTDGRPLKGRVDSEAALNAAIEHLNRLEPRPDLVLVTGDLVNKARKQDYQGLRRKLDRLNMPSYVIPGNHDERDMIRRYFGDCGYLPDDGDFLHYTIDDDRYPLRLIGLDSKRLGHDGGEMCDVRLRWLDDTLNRAPDRPSLIFMHHPPFVTGIGFMGVKRFEGGLEMEAIIARHNQVQRIVCGHAHRDVTVRWGGTVASIASSLVFQMSLDLRHGAKSSFVLEPPACAIYKWHEEQGLIAHRSVIGDFGPRHPFVVDPL